MKVIDGEVVARDGSNKVVRVKAVVCPSCNEGQVWGFMIYYIEGDPNQMHLQCCNCGTTFCGHAGTCNAENMN